MALKIKKISFLFSIMFFNTFGEENIVNKVDSDLLTKVTLENNRVSAGIEVTNLAGDSISSINPFILDFEIYNSTKFKNQIFILGFIGKRDIISSFRKNNSYTDDSVKGFIWHKRFNLSAEYQKTELEIPILPDAAVKREEVNKNMSLDFDFIDIANIEILSNIYVKNVELSNDERKFNLTEGSATCTYSHNIFNKINALSKHMSGREISKIGASFYIGSLVDKTTENKNIVTFFSENNFDLIAKNMVLNVGGRIDVSASDFAFDFTLNIDYKVRDNLIVKGKINIDNSIVRYLDVLSRVEDKDVMSPVNLKRELDIFVDCGIKYDYENIAKAEASVALHRTTDKIFYEIDSVIDGNPIKLANYKGALKYLNLNGEVSYKIWKINLFSKYNYSSLDVIAFNPLHTFSLGGEFEYEDMLLKITSNYKADFYCSQNKVNKEEGYFINNISFKYKINSKANILCHVYNIFSNSGNYKKDFPIEKMKFKIEFESDF